MKTYLVLDVSYLSWRAFFTTGGLSHEDTPTGVLFGVLRDVSTLRDRFNAARCVFAFDHGTPLRLKLCPGYKASRRKKKLTDDEALAVDGMRAQVGKLRTDYLDRVGFRNVLYQTGYEADDVIAKVALQVRARGDDRVVIVSGDKDLYQCLYKDQVVVYHPREDVVVNSKSFRKKYGIWPAAWKNVKALAGCASDDVPGVAGVGEKTAIKFWTNRLGPASAAYRKIQSCAVSTLTANLPIVRLPFAGIGDFKLARDEFDDAAWDDLLADLGIKSLKGKLPGNKFTPTEA